MHLNGTIDLDGTETIVDVSLLDAPTWPRMHHSKVLLTFGGGNGALCFSLSPDHAEELLRGLDRELRVLAYESEEAAEDEAAIPCENCHHRFDQHTNRGGGADDVCHGEGGWPSRNGITCHCPEFVPDDDRVLA